MTLKPETIKKNIDYCQYIASSHNYVRLINTTLEPDAHALRHLIKSREATSNSFLKNALDTDIEQAKKEAQKAASNLVSYLADRRKVKPPVFSSKSYGNQLIKELSRDTEPRAMVEIFLSAWAKSAIDCKIALAFDQNIAVDFETFLLDPYYLGVKGVYPEILAECKAMVEGGYNQFILTGGTGSGKTSAAVFVMAYRIYLLSLLEHPQIELGIQEDHEMLFVFQNLNERKAKKGGFARFRNMIKRSEYFRERFPFQDSDSEIRFPKNIIARTTKTDETGVIGDNVFGGFIDEINFQPIHQPTSKKSKNNQPTHQGMVNYNEFRGRIATRFRGHGFLFVVSSKDHEGQPTDKIEDLREKELAETGKTNIYLFDKREWEISPPEQYERDGIKWFVVNTGNGIDVIHECIAKDLERKDAEALRDDQSDDIRHLCYAVPHTYYDLYVLDPERFMTSIIGISYRERDKFFINKTPVLAAFEPKLQTIIKRSDKGGNLDELIRITNETPLYMASKKSINLDLLRAIHLDLSHGLDTGDATGLGIGHIVKFTPVRRANKQIMLPLIKIDAILQIRGAKGGELIQSDLVGRDPTVSQLRAQD